MKSEALEILAHGQFIFFANPHLNLSRSVTVSTTGFGPVGIGSNPFETTLYLGGLAQLARAPALQAGGQRFESVILHNTSF